MADPYVYAGFLDVVGVTDVATAACVPTASIRVEDAVGVADGGLVLDVLNLYVGVHDVGHVIDDGAFTIRVPRPSRPIGLASEAVGVSDVVGTRTFTRVPVVVRDTVTLTDEAAGTLHALYVPLSDAVGASDVADVILGNANAYIRVADAVAASDGWGLLVRDETQHTDASDAVVVTDTVAGMLDPNKYVRVCERVAVVAGCAGMFGPNAYVIVDELVAVFDATAGWGVDSRESAAYAEDVIITDVVWVAAGALNARCADHVAVTEGPFNQNAEGIGTTPPTPPGATLPDYWAVGIV